MFCLLNQTLRLKLLSFKCCKKLFIFLCTLMPFLSVDVLDRFCLALNCDRRQTKAISKYLDEVQKNNDRSRASKAYMARVTDYHWSKILENESNAHFLNDAKAKNAAAFHREKLKIALEGSKSAKMNVPYRIIGKLMHLDPVTVGLYVLHSKHILGRIINRPPKGLDKKNVSLPRFEPFREFGIETLNKPA